jgi:hypothetical protein
MLPLAHVGYAGWTYVLVVAYKPVYGVRVRRRVKAMQAASHSAEAAE